MEKKSKDNKFSEKKDYRRFDFIQEIESFDETTRKITLRLTPDPRRYEKKTIKGEDGWYDKLDKTFMPNRVFKEMAKEAINIPIYFQQQLIDNTDDYIKERLSSIHQRLLGNKEHETFEDKSSKFLESLLKNELGFTIMCIDIVGSTILTQDLCPKKYTNLIQTTLYEISEIIPQFHGHVLKYTGDGLLAYFPEPSFIIKNDLAVDCALSIRLLVNKGLNRVFVENEYPTINIRAGIDCGNAYITTIGSPKTKQQKDIIGEVVNLAAKIQSIGNPGDVLIGETTERNLHTTWRLQSEAIELPKSWNYKDLGGNLYKVFRMKC